MGSSYSCIKARSRGIEKKGLKRDVFVWKIDGFSSLLEQGEGYVTIPFQMQGITWYLSMNPMDWKSGDTSSENHVSLFISVYATPEYMLETKFKFFIHDQMYGKHIEREVRHTFLMTSYQSGVSCMVPLEALTDATLGFLMDDTIAVGVELIHFKKVPCNGLERISFIQKKNSSGSYSWYIEDFFQVDRPVAFSETFQIAGYNWILRLEPEGLVRKEYVSLYLILAESQLPPSSGVMVDMVFSIKTSPSRAYERRTCYNFNSSNIFWGLMEFIRLEEFKNPSNGYLIKGTCTFEASVSVYGSAEDRAS